MSNVIPLLLAALGGAAGGVFFFGGLWWTIRLGLRSSSPGLWFLGSLMVRTAMLVTIFLWIVHADWRRAVACLAGFLGMRVVIQILSRLPQSPVLPGNARAAP